MDGVPAPLEITVALVSAATHQAGEGPEEVVDMAAPGVGVGWVGMLLGGMRLEGGRGMAVIRIVTMGIMVGMVVGVGEGIVGGMSRMEAGGEVVGMEGGIADMVMLGVMIVMRDMEGMEGGVGMVGGVDMGGGGIVGMGMIVVIVIRGARDAYASC